MARAPRIGRRNRKGLKESMNLTTLSQLYAETTDDLLYLFAVEGDAEPYAFRFHSGNPAFFRATGFPESIAGKDARDFLLPDRAEEVLRCFAETIRQRRPRKFESSLACSAEVVSMETTLTPIFGENGTPRSLLGVSRDITERKRVERFIRESEERYRSLVQLSPDAILIHDRERILFCNEACASLVQAEHPEELFGANLLDFVAPEDRRQLSALLARAFQGGGRLRPFEMKIVRRDGKTVDVECASALVEHEGRKLLQAVVRDITQRSLEKERLERLSQIDGLTEIANRRFFDAVLAREVNRARRNGRPLSLLMIDIDNFKAYNDKYGHLAGDECLRKIAKTLEERLKRPGDFPARYGGEEFAVLLPETDETGALAVAEQIRAGVEALAIRHEEANPLPIVTVSIGVSAMPRPSAADIVPLLERADRALYLAKRNGKNRVERIR